MAKERLDLYQRVTDAITAELEKGVRPWTKPWSADSAAGRIEQPLRATGQPYKGINVLLLWGSSLGAGYTSPTWMTYKQAADRNAQVRKGERGTMIVYADGINCRDEETDEDREGRIPRPVNRLMSFRCVEALGILERLERWHLDDPATRLARPVPRR